MISLIDQGFDRNDLRGLQGRRQAPEPLRPDEADKNRLRPREVLPAPATIRPGEAELTQQSDPLQAAHEIPVNQICHIRLAYLQLPTSTRREQT